MISRRSFVAGSVLFAGSCLLVASCDQAADSGSEIPSSSSDTLVLYSGMGTEFDALLLSLTGTDALGSAWLAQNGSLTAEQLSAALATKLEHRTEDIVTALAAWVQEDFQQQRLCNLSGWQLSVTECQLLALRHMLLLKNPSNAQHVAKELTIQAVTDYPVAEIAALSNWGPKSTLVGKPFNVQLDGHSGFWFKLKGAPAHAKIAINGELVKTSVSADVVTSGLFDEMQQAVLSAPGTHDISLVDPVRGVRQPLGQFVVRSPKEKPLTDSAVFCEIENWGPRATRAGQAKNEQPDGGMGLWVRSTCMPRDTKLLVGDDELDTDRRPFGVTASIPAALIAAPGKLQLILFSPTTTQRQTLGVLLVE